MVNDSIFIPGKITVLLDASGGSSGKGKLESFVTQQEKGKYHFVCNTYWHQASHVCMDRNYPTFVYKQFNSCAHRHEEFEKMYIGQGAIMTLKSFFAELEMTGIPHEKVGIHPLVGITQDIDRLYEEGKVAFCGSPNTVTQDGTVKHGSTCSGVGVTRARRVLRDKNLVLAKDVPELAEFICDVSEEIIDRCDRGQSGLLSLAQGFQLSNGYKFYPYCTGRNVTVAAGFDDMFLPVSLLGNVILNLRTYPIRIASKKYICTETGKHLTWEEVKSGDFSFETVESYSGDGYADQEELSWETLQQENDITIPEDVILTSLTKLPRRVFSYSKENLRDSIVYNQTPHNIFLSLNFVNWVDGNMESKTEKSEVTDKVLDWIEKNIKPVTQKFQNVQLKWLGTGRYTEDTITLN